MKVYQTGPTYVNCPFGAYYDGMWCRFISSKEPLDIDPEQRCPDCPAPSGLVSVDDMLEVLETIRELGATGNVDDTCYVGDSLSDKVEELAEQAIKELKGGGEK